MPTIGELGEHEVIRRIRALAPSPVNGDDAAVLPVGSTNSRTVVATDTLVQDRHFRLDWSSPHDIGVKAVTQNCADIEAMGARATAVLLALSAPPTTPMDLVAGIVTGMHDALGAYPAQLVGGDLTTAPTLILGVTAVGSLGGNLPALGLDRARPGQTLVATGTIGYSAAGLDLLRAYGPHDFPPEFEELRRAHCAPVLWPGRGMMARATGATGATDNSDGLLADVGHLARESGVDIDLDAAALAPDDLLTAAADLLSCDPWDWILGGGEDHTILATTAAAIPSGFRKLGTVGRPRTAGTPGAVTISGQDPQPHTGWVSF
ncbi:thiamine-phosphate kinase [Corynebacterium uberis]|uniref:thiamine-phosphate kinase n=1 Tax=Corynebacterium TaxID=1716 RepID=UPI001D0AEEE3|nr:MULTISPECIES: thiamine-phosphate kinase [Corynebacterium]MCZ9309134.1 thiamine-phosphate kinase [Corynebacterium sp. c6VSa_13]UDL74404.1 thiamine-phosphate kinase [Corynebacterium uberis]UDL76762.1 thiamine-phosphate kinase [Corynebacterium uberis]UDL78975.1 thiamine-phosphate kinase [Corynebacterium uberis]UDL81252.1 thiamine-phosphate kinase [Corynebacterium uberis]